MKPFFRRNGLSIVTFGLFVLFLIGQTATGYSVAADEQRDHGQPVATLAEYVTSGDFGEAVFENWESEFLQMGLYVLLTIWLFQKGSAESKDPDGDNPTDRDPAKEGGSIPARFRSFFYRNGLSLALLILFVLSFGLHVATAAAAYNDELPQHGKPQIATAAYVETSQFWFESFQNWQSEFLAIGCMIVFSICLRQIGSSQSKPLDAPNEATGES